jgi:hypothetical protein
VPHPTPASFLVKHTLLIFFFFSFTFRPLFDRSLLLLPFHPTHPFPAIQKSRMPRSKRSTATGETH